MVIGVKVLRETHKMYFLECQEYSKWQPVPTLMENNERIPGMCGVLVEPTIVGGEKAGPL